MKNISDGWLSFAMLALLLAGIAGGYLFAGSYPMQWQEKTALQTQETEAIRQELLDLGFPEDILADLSRQELLALEKPKQVQVITRRRHANDKLEDLDLITVAVELEAERKTWRFIHHFRWNGTQRFVGTECVKITPACRPTQDWFLLGDYTGQVFYDDGKIQYVSDYYSLEVLSYTQSSFFGNSSYVEPFAAFSLPARAENARGYVAYTVYSLENEAFYPISYVYYTHQESWLQYPVKTAVESRLEASKLVVWPFVTGMQQAWPVVEVGS